MGTHFNLSLCRERVGCSCARAGRRQLFNVVVAASSLGACVRGLERIVWLRVVAATCFFGFVLWPVSRPLTSCFFV